MQDGAPPHIGHWVQHILWLFFFSDGRIIGRAFPMAWPQKLPDLNSCDFWLWSYLKNVVYQLLKDNKKLFFVSVYKCVFIYYALCLKYQIFIFFLYFPPCTLRVMGVLNTSRFVFYAHIVHSKPAQCLIRW